VDTLLNLQQDGGLPVVQLGDLVEIVNDSSKGFWVSGLNSLDNCIRKLVFTCRREGIVLRNVLLGRTPCGDKIL
jgi:hypothetical protein